MTTQRAASLVAQYRPPRAAAPESAGPCLVAGCGGTLEVRHERLYGKVYTACPACESRVSEVRRLRAIIAQMRLRPSGTGRPSQASRPVLASRDRQIAEMAASGMSQVAIGRQFAITGQRVCQILARLRAAKESA